MIYQKIIPLLNTFILKNVFIYGIVMISKIISGGQTGVDRAALDVAIKLNLPHGGWCPKGRLAELGGIIPHRYSLQETNSSDVSIRTKLNIRDSDGTLVFVPELPLKVTDGTILTLHELQERNKHHFIFNLANPPEPSQVCSWIEKNNIKILNVAGPRESQSPGIYSQTLMTLGKIISLLLSAQLLSDHGHAVGMELPRPRL